jgi:hypothetical protein
MVKHIHVPIPNQRSESASSHVVEEGAVRTALTQDLRDRVIDAVERAQLSRRAAARHYEVSVSVAIKWLERVEA